LFSNSFSAALNASLSLFKLGLAIGCKTKEKGEEVNGQW
jgi:hypothetical protein